MSYKCAILGHNYGDAEVEREREEDGKEVVITVREIETCARCDDERVVSENKEVTTLETAADIVADDLVEGTDTTDQSADAAAEPATTTQEPASQSTATDPEIPEAESEVPDEAVGPEEDDAVILEDDDEPEEPDEETRDPGEWPEEADDTEQAKEGDADWPEEDTDGDDTPDWELPTDIDPHPETEGSVGRTAGDALTVPEGEFYCPECEFTTAVESSSLRAGDFCPECRQGTLEHQRD